MIFREFDVITPPANDGMYHIRKGYYWACANGDPKRALIGLSKSGNAAFSQCNPNEKIMKGLQESYPKGTSIVFIETSYQKVDPYDFI